MKTPNSQLLIRTLLFSRKPYWRRLLSSGAISLWPLSELAGRTAFDLSGRLATNVDLVVNGGFETPGGGGADLFAVWLETAGDGAISDEASLVHSGGHAVRLTSGPTVNTWVFQYSSGNTVLRVIPGMACTLNLWTRGDGINSGRYAIKNETSGAYITSLTSLAVPGTSYTLKNISFTIPVGCYSIVIYLAGPAVNGGVCYFDDVSLTADQPLHGLYSVAGITYGQPGLFAPAAQFSGASSSVQIGSPAFNAFWNGNCGSALAWGMVDGSARWTDASEFRYLFHAKSRPDQTVYLVFGKHTDSHTLFWRRRLAAGTYEKKYVFAPTGTLDWFCMGMTWDVVSTPKRIACYLYTHADRVFQVVSDEAPAAGNESWDNNTYPVDDINTLLMAGGPSSQEWIGLGSLSAYWSGQALSIAQMQRMMVP